MDFLAICENWRVDTEKARADFDWLRADPHDAVDQDGNPWMRPTRGLGIKHPGGQIYRLKLIASGYGLPRYWYHIDPPDMGPVWCTGNGSCTIDDRDFFFNYADGCQTDRLYREAYDRHNALMRAKSEPIEKELREIAREMCEAGMI